ncbi:hypothetical protein DL766_002988 [Monosporascus sp. MC13-8B]|uniref:NmrA-like domain-containing protein n=1 Tax=Monosporascus cannonballus TaxID=155416 RepID=A0ABY0HJ92_9PEZI|nr:hypothetical protein DL762_000954 [Monosporascus cannonballus]RYP34467.1 hypothetical protein DL766_002988 [Monosporascus sp. MC13-8B]
MAIKNVVVAGGSGNLGKAIVKELLKAGYKVTVFARENSTSTFPSEVPVRKVDYGSVESLKHALEGQDAVVSTLATVAVVSQNPLIDAAVEAGVKRLIPSEFGINTRIVEGTAIGQLLQGKIKSVDYLEEKSKANPGFTWTGVSSGLFFDWGLKHGASGFNKSTKTATIYDSGNEAVQASNLRFIGRAVAAILANEDKTANKYLSVGSPNFSQNEVLKIVERETGEKWEVQKASTADEGKIGLEKLSKGDYSAFSNLLKERIFKDGAGLAAKGDSSANGLLGLQEESLEDTIKAWLRS